MVEPRRTEITNLIDREGTITFQRLKSQFPFISEMTLRTDLKALDKQGRIVRTYGGAKSCETVVRSDDLFFKKATRNIHHKKAIAQKAVTLLKPNMTFFLDCGTTMMELARLIPDERCLIITNSISSILELSRLTKPEVVMLGGKLNRFNLSTNNNNNKKVIEKMNFDISFIATTGYVSGVGFTCTMETDDELRHMAIKRGQKVVVLMDSSKVGQMLPVTYATLNDVDIIISDSQLDPAVIKEFKDHGVTVYLS